MNNPFNRQIDPHAADFIGGCTPGEKPENTTMIIESMVQRSLEAGPMRTADEDQVLFRKVKKFFRPGETTINQLCGRIGIGPRALREWTDDRIRGFEVLADARAASEIKIANGKGPRFSFPEPPTNQGFVMVGDT
jgi:hypothetical protein